MIKCVNCDNEAVGRSKYCGDKCKVQYNRNKKRNTVTLVGEIVTADVTVRAGTVYLPPDDKLPHGLPTNFGSTDCQCIHCKQNRASGSKLVLNHVPYKKHYELGKNERNRVSLPGDIDYNGVCKSLEPTGATN